MEICGAALADARRRAAVGETKNPFESVGSAWFSSISRETGADFDISAGVPGPLASDAITEELGL